MSTTNQLPKAKLLFCARRKDPDELAGLVIHTIERSYYVNSCWELCMNSDAQRQQYSRSETLRLDKQRRTKETLPISAVSSACIYVDGYRRAAYLPKILLTHPWETRSWRDTSQGRTPACANSMIFRLTDSGRGLPLTNTPPS